MQKMHASIHINAPREKVWDTMLNQDTYREWTKPFDQGSYYEGSWDKGSKILFLGGEGENKGGMSSRIAESRKPEFVSIEHLGVVVGGKEKFDDPEFKQWAGAHENYTFTEKDGGTELAVDLDVTDDMAAEMDAMWKKALVALKEICERA